MIRKIKRLISLNQKVTDSEFREFCSKMFLNGQYGSGIDEFSANYNATLLQRLAKDKNQLNILGEFLK